MIKGQWLIVFFFVANRKISEKYDKVFATGCMPIPEESKGPKANAAFVVLAMLVCANILMRPRPEVVRHHRKTGAKPSVVAFMRDVPYVVLIVG